MKTLRMPSHSTINRTALLTILLSALVGFSGVSFFGQVARAEIDLSKDFDSLGGNEKLVKKAKALDPHNRVTIVQKRVVDRNLRLELGVNFGGVLGGDSYYNTQNIGGNVDFHINPRWSVGARYYSSRSNLTSEGESVFNEARRKRNMGDLSYGAPELSSPLQTWLGTVSWYPVYGKTNIFDLAVVQFDIYTLVGYGQIELESSRLQQPQWTDVFTAGGGVGLWLTQHISSRLEARWQTYEDQLYTGSRRMNVGVVTVSLGLLL